MKFKEKQEVLELRKQGLSLRDIARKVPVSRSTISRWAREIQLTKQQSKALISRSAVAGNQMKGAQSHKDKAHNRRLQWQLDGELMVATANNLFVAGCMLFWAEGTKNRNSVRFCNSDVEMMKFWIRFLLHSFKVSKDRISIKVQVHLENGLSIKQIEQFWIKSLSLPSSCLTKTTIVQNHPRSKGYRKNKLSYGVCQATIDNTELAQKLFGAIKEIAGFDKRLCLD